MFPFLDVLMDDAGNDHRRFGLRRVFLRVETRNGKQSPPPDLMFDFVKVAPF